jgi:HTH-type transcriptional regulator/antitoxin HigA
MRMDIRPLRTEADYDWALAEIEAYFRREPIPGTPQADRFDVLAVLIAEYERRYWPIDPPDPGAAIRARMEQARRLHEAWRIPAEVLIQPPRPRNRTAAA